MQSYDFFIFLLKASFVVIIVLSIAIGVLWPLFQNFSGRAEPRNIESPVRYRPQRTVMFPKEEDELEIPTTGKNQDDLNREILKMAMEDPSKTTHLVRNWIKEKK